jgi:hypothetical protein
MRAALSTYNVDAATDLIIAMSCASDKVHGNSFE